MAKPSGVEFPVTIEGRQVRPGPDVMAVRFEDGQYVVEYREFRYDTIDEVIASGALLEVEPQTSR